MSDSKRQKMTHVDVMIDIETLSTEPTAVILNIAAIRFCPFTGEVSDTIEILLDIEDCLSLGCTKSEDTVKWWNSQKDSIKNHVLYGSPRYKLKDSLFQLIRFAKGTKRFWAQGINFDPVILEYAYKVCGLTPPWKFWQWRDSRTIQKLTNIPASKDASHSALEDCKRQVEFITNFTKKFDIKELF